MIRQAGHLIDQTSGLERPEHCRHVREGPDSRLLPFSSASPPMETTRLSSKGQVVLPKTIRDARKLTVGAAFIVEDRPEGILLRPLQPSFAETRIEDVLGCVAYGGPARSLEQMDAAIARSAAALRGSS